jgi:hypothetical protein
MGGQVFPEGQPEDLLVSRLPGVDPVQQRAPGVRHPSTDAVQVQEGHLGELAGGLVDLEPSRRGLGEDAAGDQLAKDGVQRGGITAGRLGQRGDVVVAVLDQLRQAQRGGHPQAPRRSQVEHLLEVHSLDVHGGVPRLIFYHRDVFLFSLRSDPGPILSGRRDRRLGEKGHRG